MVESAWMFTGPLASNFEPWATLLGANATSRFDWFVPLACLSAPPRTADIALPLSSSACTSSLMTRVDFIAGLQKKWLRCDVSIRCLQGLSDGETDEALVDVVVAVAVVV